MSCIDELQLIYLCKDFKKDLCSNLNILCFASSRHLLHTTNTKMAKAVVRASKYRHLFGTVGQSGKSIVLSPKM
jgi:hypothetical protein